MLPVPVRTSIGRRGGAAGADPDPRLVLPPPPESEWVIPYANDQRRAHAARRGAGAPPHSYQAYQIRARDHRVSSARPVPGAADRVDGLELFQGQLRGLRTAPAPDHRIVLLR